ncbi:metalloregulator ArsR/SmtB family transcription factor [Paenarthrobacter sp. PH39-S1]|nr:metalloregulator ArsR/SmtB family transcription factor [Paenarthrobacter sp. PH39-S1]MDJ0355957.1 metalloregulator ArsR/SmtB family transcription factor [Paenarthrobacter sp. PH39-S1]
MSMVYSPAPACLISAPGDADPERLRLPSILKAADDGEACVCDLTSPLDLGQPTVSHHPRILLDAGLLSREKRGTWALYAVQPPSIV